MLLLVKLRGTINTEGISSAHRSHDLRGTHVAIAFAVATLSVTCVTISIAQLQHRYSAAHSL